MYPFPSRNPVERLQSPHPLSRPCPVRHPFSIGYLLSSLLSLPCPVRHPFSIGHLLSSLLSLPCPVRYPFPHRYPIRFRMIRAVHRPHPVRYPIRFRLIPPFHPDPPHRHPIPPHPIPVTGSHRLGYPCIPPRIANHKICTRLRPRIWLR